MITVPCEFGGPDHEYPDDWLFGGDDGNDPAADPRFQVTHYQYIDDEFGFSFMSGMFRCDDAALDYFTTVAESDPRVKYIMVKRPGETKFSKMSFEYDISDDTVYDIESEKEVSNEPGPVRVDPDRPIEPIYNV